MPHSTARVPKIKGVSMLNAIRALRSMGKEAARELRADSRVLQPLVCGARLQRGWPAERLPAYACECGVGCA